MSYKTSVGLGWQKGTSLDQMQPLDAWNIANRFAGMPAAQLSFGDRFRQMLAKSWLQKNPDAKPLDITPKNPLVSRPIANTPYGIWNIR